MNLRRVATTHATGWFDGPDGARGLRRHARRARPPHRRHPQLEDRPQRPHPLRHQRTPHLTARPRGRPPLPKMPLRRIRPRSERMTTDDGDELDELVGALLIQRAALLGEASDIARRGHRWWRRGRLTLEEAHRYTILIESIHDIDRALEGHLR